MSGAECACMSRVMVDPWRSPSQLLGPGWCQQAHQGFAQHGETLDMDIELHWLRIDMGARSPQCVSVFLCVCHKAFSTHGR